MDAQGAVVVADTLVLGVLIQIPQRDEVADVQLIHLVPGALDFVQVFLREEATVAEQRLIHSAKLVDTEI